METNGSPPHEEEKAKNPDCPGAELSRDEKGMLYYRLDDFEKIFKQIALFLIQYIGQ